MIVSKIKPTEVNKTEKATVEVDGTMQIAATKVQTDHMTGAIITLDAIPGAAITMSALEIPRFDLWIRRRTARGRAAYYEALFELQESKAVVTLAAWMTQKRGSQSNRNIMTK